MFEVYTDGATTGNGKANAPGGWAYVILKDGVMIAQDSGGEIGTTNQRMELTAALNASPYYPSQCRYSTRGLT